MSTVLHWRRWMLLSFKREFDAEDGLRLFEMLSARDVEMSTNEAQRAQELETKKDYEHLGTYFTVVF